MPATTDRFPIEAEQNLIALAFIDADWLTRLKADLKPSDFAEPKHQTIWSAIDATTFPGQVAAEDVLIDYLRKLNLLEQAGGIHGIVGLTSQTHVSPQASRWHESVLEATRLRKLDARIASLSRKSESGMFSAEEISADLAAIQADTVPRKAGDNGPKNFSLYDLLNFEKEKDPNAVLGDRWLCKGGSCMLIAQTGAGKSALCTQMALSWAMGRDAFGIKSVARRRLRSVIIQSENDLGDVSEAVQGAIDSLGLARASQEVAALADMVHFYREAIRTGEDFGTMLRQLVIKHQADIVWIDPLLGFAGIDIADQEAVSHFTRHIIQPVLDETGVILMTVHHTVKPVKDAGKVNLSDLAYAGAGSADLANWHRASMVLQKDPTPEGQDELPHYTLRLAKRGGRAGVKDDQGQYTRTIPLQHSKVQGRIAWERRQTSDIANRPIQQARRGVLIGDESP
jgi:RecA-family ATPase